MKGLIIVLFLVSFTATGLGRPMVPDHPEDIALELRTDEQILNTIKNTQFRVGSDQINLDGNLNNDQYAKIGLLGALFQRFPTPAPGSSGNVNYVFYSPLGALIQKLRPTTTTTTTTTTTAATTTTSSADSTTTTTTTTTTPATTTTTTTPATTTTTTTPATTPSTTPTTTTVMP